MIFVSYSHKDEEWRERFETMVDPLARFGGTECWSDRKIQAGKDWEGEINVAMCRANFAVLLVSMHFLKSKFIAEKEMPFFFKAAAERRVNVFWVLVTHCMWTQFPDLKRTQAFHLKELKPLNTMRDGEWQETLCALGEKIGEFVLDGETPTINAALQGQTLGRIAKNLQVLSKPAIRETEVLIYCGDGRWYTQSKVKKGSMQADCWIGDVKATKPGDRFTIVALTRDTPLGPGTAHPRLPIHRTKSKEVTVIRA